MKYWATEYLKTANVARSLIYSGLGTVGGALAGGALGSVLGAGSGGGIGSALQDGIQSDPNAHLPALDQPTAGFHTPVGDVRITNDDVTPFMRSHPSIMPGMMGGGGAIGGLAGGAGAGAMMGGLGGLALGARSGNRQEQQM